MPRNGAGDDSGSDSIVDSFRPSRRSYLKAAGAAAVSVPLLAGEAAAEQRHGISFDNVVDMVDDAGADPDGNEACDGALQDAAGSNTLLKFPSGTYKFTEKNALSGNSNFGIVGDGDVTFTVPDDFNDKLLAINYGTGVLVENITIDQSNATPDVLVAPDDGLEIHDLTFDGQGISSATDGGDPGYALSPMVRSSGGEGRVENFVAHNEGRMGAYARNGVWIGDTNKGTVTLRNCNVEGFSGNGVYASRTPGVVKVEGGTYKNNDVSQVRIGSSGSYIEGASVEADVSDSRSPNPGEMKNGSGIRLENPNGGSGAAIRDCDVRIGPEVNADTGIKVFPNYGDFTIENTRVEFNTDGYSIRASSPNGSGGSGTLRNVNVTGDATGLVGVLIEDRPDTAVENCCIQQTGSGRTGLALHNCDGSQVENCTINAGAQALRQRNGSVSVSSIQNSGTCPAPNLSSSSYDGSSSGSSSDSSSDDSSSDDSSSDDSSSGDSSSSDSSSDDSSSDTSSDSSSDDSSSDDSSSDDSSSDGSSSSSDSSSDSSSSSDDSSSDDSSGSSGNSDGSGSDDELSGDIDESDVPEPSGSANFVVTDTDTSGGRIPYEVQTSSDIEKSDTGGATQDDNDDISGNTASGGVNEWRDAFEYEGEIVSLEVDDRATIKLNGDEGTITVVGEDEYVDYSLEVTGDLTATESITSEDSISGNETEAAVESGRDVYNYTGKLVQASIEDSVSITTNPDTLNE